MDDVMVLLNLLSKKASDANRKDILEKVKSEDFVSYLREFREICDCLNIDLIADIEDLMTQQMEINMKISRALVKNYTTMYYVNYKTGHYVGYSSSDDYKALNVEADGTDFFSDCVKNAKQVIYPEDLDLVIKTLSKDNLVKGTENGKIVKIYYRLMTNGEPRYVSLKASRIDNDDENIILGISILDTEQRKALEFRKMYEKDITYSNIALALARNYFYIYYVDMINDDYIEYNIDYENQELHEVIRGKDFFNETIRQSQIYIVPEDRDKFLHALKKENILNSVADGNLCKLNYRQIINGNPVYVEFTAMPLSSDSTHLLLAISNIDQWKRQEDKYNKKIAQEMQIARTDALTGALNKYSYKELTKRINKGLKNKIIEDIAVVVCDINNLKRVNDTLGHEAGDKYIKSAYKMIKKVYKNSDIYRIGGDEFALILSGSDYYIREYLYKEIVGENNKNKELNKVTVAIGMADYNKEVHHTLTEVFEIADVLMYEYKANFKKKN